MLYIVGVISGIYIGIGFANAVLYALSTGIVSLGYVSNVDFFKHWFLWPVYLYFK